MPNWKRCIDITAGLVALPVLAVCVFVVALIHSLVSPGPIFFMQERVGHRGRRFLLRKFRTMRAHADTRVHQAYCRDLINSNAPMMKMDAKGDPRLIPGGWLLRASGMDELPQLINVLLGDMSLIGPRPCMPSEYAEYGPQERLRLDARPGLTGLWQVSGKNRTTFAEMIRLDIEYTRTCSFRLDVKILVLTLPALVNEIRDARTAHRKARRSQAAISSSSTPSLIP